MSVVIAVLPLRSPVAGKLGRARLCRILLALGLLVLAALALPGGTEAASFNEIKKLLASDAEAFDIFGVSVAVSGNTAVVGAWHEDAGGSNAGAAYVFDPLLPKPIGGISLDLALRPLALETSGSASSPWAVVVGIASVAFLLALGGAAWYALPLREGQARRRE